MEDIRIHLGDLLSEVSIFPPKDLLVNLGNAKCVPFKAEGLKNSGLIKSILRDSRATERKTGVTSLCVAFGTCNHKLKGEEIESPVFLQHVEVKSTDTESTIFRPIGEMELNPFLKKLLLTEKPDKGINNFEELKEVIVKLNSGTLNEEKVYLGNFEPKRFAFIREIKTLLEPNQIYSNALIEIYGNDVENNRAQIDAHQSLFQLDDSQEKLTSVINEQSAVLQGPPGTGKSQVLSNFLGKALLNQKSTLVISEKHAAIDVLCNKVNTKGLTPLCFKIPSKNSNRACIQSLKESWDALDCDFSTSNKKYFERLNAQKKEFVLLNEVSKKENCTKLELLDILETNSQTKQNNIPKDNLKFSDLKAVSSIWSSIPEGNADILKHLTKDCFKKEFKSLLNEVTSSIPVLNQLDCGQKWIDTKNYLKQSLAHHSFMSEPYTTYGKHLNNRAEFFIKHQNEYQKLKRKISTLIEHEEHWKKKPNRDELTYLHELFSQKKGFLSLISRWTTWRKFTRTPELNPIEQIQKRKAFYRTLVKLNAIEEKLYSVGIEDLEIELPIISKLIKSTDLNAWDEFQKENAALDHKTIYNCLSSLKRNFNFSDENKPLPFLESFIRNKAFLSQYWSRIQKIPPSLLHLWQNNLVDVELSAKVSLKRRILLDNPGLSGCSRAKSLKDIKEINKEFNSESMKLSKNILEIWSTSFKKLNALTRQDPRKLGQEEKDFRKKLKKGKSILTKEFAKKRSHKSIRELLLSEARPWIDVLKPIWLGNPSLLADHLPMEREMFDYVVSDESSQLLLSHSIGAFQRGTKSIICGDPKQMVPSSYFKEKQASEMSLLQHAYYHLPKIFLSNHYRSIHPRLMEFSNTHFYQNRLKSFQNIKAISDPIEHHFIHDGVFHERKNVKEANTLAQKIKAEIDNTLKIGIVAFSETQLGLIHECLDDDIRVKLNKRIEENTAFSHSLENVQGDECDILFISMGYAYNEDGNFEMRFGPINVQGGHHRLNVLFSRAKQKIHFFSSVGLKDFSKSKNEGVLHLIKWFDLMGQKDAVGQPNENIKFDEIINTAEGFADVLSYTSVFIERGYSITL